uniref:Uncharacterized protein n=1 Tax=Sparus aurata TaxID=8175 RepID=A0A671U3J7_SPAAU
SLISVCSQGCRSCSYCSDHIHCVTLTGNNKIFFGEGTKLTLQSKELAEPDYYKLEGNGTTACLATGFTRQNGTADHTYFEEYFNKTAAVRVGDDKVYNQVALLSDDGDKCEKGSGSEATPCEDSIKPDPTVNFVSVTVLCLRVIFIKTIVFNVLLTFRLWISQ